jgi:hypothetical protein
MTMAVRPSALMTLLDQVSPVSQAAGTVTTAWVDALLYETLFAFIQAGVLGAAATLDAKLEQATTVGGAGAKNVTGSLITQLVKASNDNNQVCINCQDEDLDSAGGFRFVRLSLTVGTAASLIAASLWGFAARYQPAAHKNTLVQELSVNP